MGVHVPLSRLQLAGQQIRLWPFDDHFPIDQPVRLARPPRIVVVGPIRLLPPSAA